MDLPPCEGLVYIRLESESEHLVMIPPPPNPFDVGTREALLKAHVKASALYGTMFHHVFKDRRLGLTIQLTRFGDTGRSFVEVASTTPGSSAYGTVFPSDELVEIDGELITEAATHAHFEVILDRISRGARPMKLTFVKGPRRGAAMRAQERLRLARQEGYDSPLTVVEGPVLFSDSAERAVRRAAPPTSTTPDRELARPSPIAAAKSPLQLAVTRIDDDVPEDGHGGGPPESTAGPSCARAGTSTMRCCFP